MEDLRNDACLRLVALECAICEEEIALEEPGRPVTAAECRDDARFLGALTVANAHCVGCGALYLAWVRLETPIEAHAGYLRNPGDEPFVDLSFRHSFRDRPDPRDLPPRERLRAIHHAQLLAGAAESREQAADHVASAEMAERMVADDEPSYWELFLAIDDATGGDR
jgi:hypothetical protein